MREIYCQTQSTLRLGGRDLRGWILKERGGGNQIKCNTTLAKYKEYEISAVNVDSILFIKYKCIRDHPWNKTDFSLI